MPRSPMPRPVTVLGLGAMGSALARSFLAAGHPTTVWNRTPARAAPLATAGAAVADHLVDAVTGSDLLVVCVRDHGAVHEILASLDGHLGGRTVVNLSSSTPEEARSTATWLAARESPHLDGAVMVPTPLVGTDDALVLYGGPRADFDANADVLRALGGDADHLGDDPGLASLFDLGMLDLFFAGMTAFLHAAALVGADGVTAERFLPYAQRITTVLDVTLPAMASDVDRGDYPGDADTLDMELAAVDHIVEASGARGIDVTVPETTRRLVADAIAAGHGREGFTRVIEHLRQAG